MAKATFNKMSRVLTGGIKQELMKQPIKTLVWNVVKHRSETWSSKNVDATRLQRLKSKFKERIKSGFWGRREQPIRQADKSKSSESCEWTTNILTKSRRKKGSWIRHPLRQWLPTGARGCQVAHNDHVTSPPKNLDFKTSLCVQFG